MEVISNVHEGSLTVLSDTIILGQQVGPVIQQPNSELFVKGIILGDLHIKSGARCVVHGTVIGSIKNRGTLKIYGLVNGEISSEQGALMIDTEARVLKPSSASSI